jgi:hypothetical protein
LEVRLKKVSFLALVAGVAYWVMKRNKHEREEPEPEMAAAAASDTSPSEG